jgi:hypothetical protein
VTETADERHEGGRGDCIPGAATVIAELHVLILRNANMLLVCDQPAERSPAGPCAFPIGIPQKLQYLVPPEERPHVVVLAGLPL